MSDITKCPSCGSTEIGEGKLSGYAAIQPVGKIMSMGSPILAAVCSNCGLIVQMKVKHPKNLHQKDKDNSTRHYFL